MFFAVIGGMVVGFLLNFLLVPTLQDKGAAIANVVAEIIVTVLYFYFVQKHRKFYYEWILLLKALISALPFIPLVMFIRTFALSEITVLLSSVLSCAMIYFCFQYFLFHDHFIYKFIKENLFATALKKISNNE